MNRRSPLESVEDILSEIIAIEEFMIGVNSLEELQKDPKTIYAVTRAIEIIGEAVKQIPEGIRLKYSAIPWKQVAGMRDKSIHEYWSLDTNILWKTTQDSIPQLKNTIIAIIEDLQSSE